MASIEEYKKPNNVEVMWHIDSRNMPTLRIDFDDPEEYLAFTQTDRRMSAKELDAEGYNLEAEVNIATEVKWVEKRQKRLQIAYTLNATPTGYVYARQYERDIPRERITPGEILELKNLKLPYLSKIDGEVHGFRDSFAMTYWTSNEKMKTKVYTLMINSISGKVSLDYLRKVIVPVLAQRDIYLLELNNGYIVPSLRQTRVVYEGGSSKADNHERMAGGIKGVI